MCNSHCLRFVERALGASEVKGKKVLELGSYDVNGSVRPYIQGLGPAEYVGVDMTPGPSVDFVCNAEDLLVHFDAGSFDVVVTTEMLEHVHDWRKVIFNMKRVAAPGGLVIITTRSRGFPLHDFPHDYWRFEREDMKLIFSDCNLLSVEPDMSGQPGIFVAASTPSDPGWQPLDLSGWALWSAHTDVRSLEAGDPATLPAFTSLDLSRLAESVEKIEAELSSLRVGADVWGTVENLADSLKLAENAQQEAAANAQRTKDELVALLATRTFRWTSGPRSIYSRLRRFGKPG